MTDTVLDTPKHTTSCNMVRSRAWVIVWNNYTEKDFTDTETQLKGLGAEYVLGREIGESGTPHIQGVFRFKNARTKTYINKLFPHAWTETCKNWEGSKIYCGKDQNYVTNIKLNNSKLTIMEERALKHWNKKYENISWKEWQQNIINLVNQEPDTRKIHWYWEETGNIGKSFLGGYLDFHKNLLTCGGKASDIFDGIRRCQLENQNINGVVIDLCRSQDGYISYKALEDLKNERVFCTKYECGRLLLYPMHIIVFANREPEYNKLSQDRWDVNYIGDKPKKANFEEEWFPPN